MTLKPFGIMFLAVKLFGIHGDLVTSVVNQTQIPPQTTIQPHAMFKHVGVL